MSDTATSCAPFSLNADPVAYVLAAKAFHIKNSALFDPMAAVHSSAIQPLPHQIRAVYQELLPRVPLRFLLADDPGAGKTIMAGLYIKELMLRGACERALIVAPGGLVDQWQQELKEKVGVSSEIFERGMSLKGHPLLIARMDQLSRDEKLLEDLEEMRWDVAIVDEAHRMSAHHVVYGNDGSISVHMTKRFALGKILSRTAKNFLLMTATPHNGSEEDFRLFLSLLDPERFAPLGTRKTDDQPVDTFGVMRRMVKEDMRDMDGHPLFPERRASTVSYPMSDQEHALYDAVTEYVRKGMHRADALAAQGERSQRSTVGFALTMLQRRVASSPAAIMRSLQRRVDKLQEALWEVEQGFFPHEVEEVEASWWSFDDVCEDLTLEEQQERELLCEDVVSASTASRTSDELRAELRELESVVRLAQAVYENSSAGSDQKWEKLAELFDEEEMRAGEKLIIFTEHKDTVDYLFDKLVQRVGNGAVVCIHGGLSRSERSHVCEKFTHDPQVQVLVATDAAGEGLNLHAAHMMVNYDLPWNPNRLEQRCGRIHRIGQKHVCHVWNMLAEGTREGAVFSCLLKKIDAQARAYRGKIFNVLGEGEPFNGKPLRDLLIEALCSDDPSTQSHIDVVIDASVKRSVRELENEPLEHEDLTLENIHEVNDMVEKARARSLQPSFVENFFRAALTKMRHDAITDLSCGHCMDVRVPFHLRRKKGISRRYSRITFDVDHAHYHEKRGTRVDYINQEHPILQALAEEILGGEPSLKNGAVLADPTAEHPIVVEAILTQWSNARESVSKSVEYACIPVENGNEYCADSFPLLHNNYGVATARDVPILDISAMDSDAVRSVKKKNSEKTRRLKNLYRQCMVIAEKIQEKIYREMNEVSGQQLHALARADDTTDKEKREKLTQRRGVLQQRDDSLEERLAARLSALKDQACIVSTCDVLFRVLVVPGKRVSVPSQDSEHIKVVEASKVPPPQNSVDAAARHAVERRAVDKVLDAERRLGRNPEEQASNNPGFDVLSTDTRGHHIFIEVKGRMQGAEDFHITSTEVQCARSHGDDYRLALVSVAQEGREHDEVRYVEHPFDDRFPSPRTLKYIESWTDHWDSGREPF